MGEHLRVNGKQIGNLVVQLQGLHRAMEGELEDLQRSLDELSNQWNGQARRAYASAQQRWNVGVDLTTQLASQFVESRRQAGDLKRKMADQYGLPAQAWPEAVLG